MFPSSFQPGPSCQLNFKLLALAVVFCFVAIVLDALRNLISGIFRDRPPGFIDLLAWALTSLLFAVVAPHTVLSNMALVAPPLVFLGCFFWRYRKWLGSREPSFAEQWSSARRIVRIFLRSQLAPRAFVMDLRRSYHLGAGAWRKLARLGSSRRKAAGR
jgi:hypothetical protein